MPIHFLSLIVRSNTQEINNVMRKLLEPFVMKDLDCKINSWDEDQSRQGIRNPKAVI